MSVNLRISIDDASLDQLRDFAASRQIKFPRLINAGHLRKLIRESGWDEDHIEIVDAPDGDGIVMASSLDPRLFVRHDLTPAEQKIRDNSWVRIVIPQSDKPDADPRIKVSHNGTAMLIDRGEESLIRWPYLHVLLCGTRLAPVTNSKREIEGWKEVSSYPVQVIDGPRPVARAA